MGAWGALVATHENKQTACVVEMRQGDVQGIPQIKTCRTLNIHINLGLDHLPFAKTRFPCASMEKLKPAKCTHVNLGLDHLVERRADRDQGQRI